MKTLKHTCATTILLLSVASISSWAENTAAVAVYRLQPEWLATTRAQIAAGDEVRQQALDELLTLAGRIMHGPDYSVTENTAVPPSGDKRDYVSTGPYWWPNPDSKDGLPWIRRDGQVNRATRGAESDSHVMGKMTEAVSTLALAYHFTDDDRYISRAVRLLQVFFLNQATAMNPNLNYGQGIPGRTEGRGIGIIESRDLMKVADAVGLMETSPRFPPTVREGLQRWYDTFLQWLVSSEHGRDESAQHNNHGTFYDAQVAHFALFTGNNALARETLRQVAETRLNPQIGAHGEQAHELARTRPFHYSSFNLKAFFTLAQLGTAVGLDLWNHQTPQGSGLRHALDYLNTYPEHPIERDDLVEKQPQPGKLLPLNQIAGLIYGPDYSDMALNVLRQGEGNLQCLLLFPVPTPGQLAPLARTLKQQSTQQEASSLCNF